MGCAAEPVIRLRHRTGHETALIIFHFSFTFLITHYSFLI